jgi:hypothetical protein
MMKHKENVGYFIPEVCKPFKMCMFEHNKSKSFIRGLYQQMFQRFLVLKERSTMCVTLLISSRCFTVVFNVNSESSKCHTVHKRQLPQCTENRQYLYIACSLVLWTPSQAISNQPS